MDETLNDRPFLVRPLLYNICRLNIYLIGFHLGFDNDLLLANVVICNQWKL